MIILCVGNSEEKASSHFSLCDLTNGRGVFYISRSGANLQHSTIKEETSADDHQLLSPDLPGGLDHSSHAHTQHDPNIPCNLDIPVTNGVSFVAGRLEFSLTALPLDELLRVRMFSAASSGDLPKLKSVIDSVGPFQAVGTASQHSRHSSPSEATQALGDIDINSEYSSPFCGDESYFDSYQKHFSVAPPSCISPSHKLLLHIAIGNRDIEMITYLLEKGADVSSNSC